MKKISFCGLLREKERISFVPAGAFFLAKGAILWYNETVDHASRRKGGRERRIDMKIGVKKLSPQAKLPTYGSEFSAGADLYALLPEEALIRPGETRLIPTGLAMEIPEGYGGFIYARSGLAVKGGLAPANKVGVIDSDYRGEIMVALYNHASEEKTVRNGDRIAQLVIAPFLKAEFEETHQLRDSARGAGGFGSTGK